jgi:delta24-sterol reductase
MDSHDRAVAKIAATIREFYSRKEPFRIYHGSTNSTRKSQYDTNRIVDTSGLSNILKVDTMTKTALVEPNVPMDRLVAATLQCGLIPPVVMEFPAITVGGGFAGTAGESSSFKYVGIGIIPSHSYQFHESICLRRRMSRSSKIFRQLLTSLAGILRSNYQLD